MGTGGRQSSSTEQWQAKNYVITHITYIGIALFVVLVNDTITKLTAVRRTFTSDFLDLKENLQSEHNSLNGNAQRTVNTHWLCS